MLLNTTAKNTNLSIKYYVTDISLWGSKSGLHSVQCNERKSIFIQQGIVDGSASKAALVQDTNYMVEKTYHIAPYLGVFVPYLMPQ